MPLLMVAALLVAACDTLQQGKETQAADQRAPTSEATVSPTAGESAVVVAPGAAPTDLLESRAQVPLIRPEGEVLATTAVRVALLLPLTGRNATLGEAMLNAAQLAVFDTADEHFELMPYDTAGNPQTAARAAQTALGEGATLIIGPLLSTSTQAAAPSAQAASVPLISFSSNRRVAGNGVFVMGFIPGAEVQRVVYFASAQGARTFSLLAPDNAYGAVVLEALRDATTTSGTRLDQVELYPVGTRDFSAVVGRMSITPARTGVTDGSTQSGVGQALALRASPAGGPAGTGSTGGQPPAPVLADALMIADGGQRLQTIAANLAYSGLNGRTVRILGTGAWDEPGINQEPTLIGGWFAAPPPEGRAAFVEKYRGAYGEAPPRLASLAYDATALAAVLARSLGNERFTADILTLPNGFMGTDGLFRFRQDGVVERGLAVIEVTPDGTRVISDAPQSFIGI